MKVSKTGHHYDDENSPISQSVPNFQASTSHTPNTSEPAIPTRFENEQKARSKRNPAQATRKSAKAPLHLKIASQTGSVTWNGPFAERECILRPEKRPREHSQKLQMLPAAASGDTRPFDLVCILTVFDHFIPFSSTNFFIVCPRDTTVTNNTEHPYDMGILKIGPKFIQRCHTSESDFYPS